MAENAVVVLECRWAEFCFEHQKQVSSHAGEAKIHDLEQEAHDDKLVIVHSKAPRKALVGHRRDRKGEAYERQASG